ncbi:choice-of-anchor Q domain-containing protein [Dokdonella sp.]|uniref:choice-of-anchor Q domain-containing protein n=1 Tax=Dokdonella sp. TaxID=2291710 RepID=UPI00262DC5F8|nr:choice-of-anchor Q domain-containing protein [Dokdonella sp.]
MHPPLFRTSSPSLSTQRRKRLHQALAAVLLIGGAAASPAIAATIVVTSPDDTNPDATGTCTLRQAIASMNTGALAGNCTVSDGEGLGVHDTITFAASALATATTPGTVTLADSADTSGTVGGTLLITADRLTVDGRAWRGTSAGHYPDGVTIARPANATKKFAIIHDTAAAGCELVLKGLAIRNGDNSGGDGGGIAMDAADLTMSSSRVSGNTANNGSGIWSPGGAVTLTRCTIDANVGGEYGGGVFSGSGNVTVTTSTIGGNGYLHSTNGGGISAGGTLTVVDSTISGNAGKRGAGIRSSGTLTLTRSVVGDNQAYYDAGGIQVLAGTATVTGSTISNNFARYNGAGLYVAGALTATNSTIAGNHGYRNGGGIALYGSGTLHLDHATLTQNGVGGTGGGIGVVKLFPGMPPWTGSATITHSIVSGNTQGLGTSDVELGSAWSGSGNLISSPNAALGPLQDNGGPTPTIRPGPGSAAIDAIAPQDCTQPIDQRGVARPWGAGCDIGAVEVVPDRIFVDGFDGTPAR